MRRASRYASDLRKPPMKLHLVDGTYELFRAYYGAPSATGRGEREVGATRGLMRSMLVLLGEPDVTHVACAFDHVIESFRNTLFAGYKTGEGIEPALYAQFALAEDACRALGIVTWPMVEFEADDALATMAARGAADAAVEQVVICSPDKDLTQCVDAQRVVCRDRMRGKLFDEGGVVERLGVRPASVPDYLALVGDSADGIPGVPRWGAKSAAAVLACYGHLEQIPDDAARWSVKVRGAAALAESLSGARREAELYRALATLRRDVPLTETPEALRWRGPDESALRKLAAELQDERIVELALAVPVKG
jgi:5'-3' exonuclease